MFINNLQKGKTISGENYTNLLRQLQKAIKSTAWKTIRLFSVSQHRKKTFDWEALSD